MTLIPPVSQSRLTWLIEADVYGNEAEPLLNEIRRQGMAAEVVPHQAIKKGAKPVVTGVVLEPTACVLGYGTYPFARQIQIHHQWRPGAWCNHESLDCTRYFGHFGGYLLNRDCEILPGVEAIRKRDVLFTKFGRDDTLFVRPAGCHKVLVGRCVDRSTFETTLAPTRYDPETLVVIASPRIVDREWRLVVIGDEVIAGSQYAVEGHRDISPDCPAEVFEFARTMLAEIRWRPDPIFMLDVGESEGRLWLIELNGFSCSWLYRCHLPTVVGRASELALQVWEKPFITGTAQ